VEQVIDDLLREHQGLFTPMLITNKINITHTQMLEKTWQCCGSPL